MIFYCQQVLFGEFLLDFAITIQDILSNSPKYLKKLLHIYSKSFNKITFAEYKIKSTTIQDIRFKDNLVQDLSSKSKGNSIHNSSSKFKDNLAHDSSSKF